MYQVIISVSSQHMSITSDFFILYSRHFSFMLSAENIITLSNHLIHGRPYIHCLSRDIISVNITKYIIYTIFIRIIGKSFIRSQGTRVERSTKNITLVRKQIRDSPHILYQIVIFYKYTIKLHRIVKKIIHFQEVT